MQRYVFLFRYSDSDAFIRIRDFPGTLFTLLNNVHFTTISYIY